MSLTKEASLKARVIFLIVFFSGLFTYVFFSVKIFDNLHTKGGESSVWIVSQIEPEALRFNFEIDYARKGMIDESGYASLLMATELLLSRLSVVDAHISNGHLQLQPENRIQWDAIKSYIPIIENITDSIGASELEVKLPEYFAHGDFLHDIREFNVGAMQSAVIQFSNQRDVFTHLIIVGIYAVGFLLTIMSILLYFTYLSYKKAQNNEIIAQQQKSFFKTICELSSEGIIAIQKSDNDVFANSVFRNIFKIPQNTNISRETLIESVGLNILGQTARKADNELNVTDFKSSDLDGQDIIIDIYNSNVKIGKEEIELYYIKDRTSEKKKTEELQNAMQEAIDANNDKARFLSTMSHEMRTPINSVIASLDYIQSRFDIQGDIAKPLSIAENCARDALEQISNVLDLSSLEKYESLSADTVFNVTVSLTKLTEGFLPLATLTKSKIHLEFPDQEDAYIRCSERTLLRVTRNLLSNSVKFTQNGKISLRCTISDNLLRLEVEDNGPGIPCDVIDNIFKPYVTSSERYSVSNDGSGLGLSIAKRAVDVLGGNIGFSTAPGEGTLFWVEIPVVHERMEPAPKAKLRPPEKFTPNVMKILLAEDDKATREITRDMLKWFGQDVTIVTNGADAIQEAQNLKYDIILMDVNMPKVNGVQATQEIRRKGLSSSSKIYGVTALQSKDDVEGLKDSGMDEVYSKPLTNTLLKPLLNVKDNIKTERRIVHKKVVQEAIRKLTADWIELSRTAEVSGFDITDEIMKELHKLKGGFLLTEMTIVANLIRKIETTDKGDQDALRLLFAQVTEQLMNTKSGK